MIDWRSGLDFVSSYLVVNLLVGLRGRYRCREVLSLVGSLVGICDPGVVVGRSNSQM